MKENLDKTNPEYWKQNYFNYESWDSSGFQGESVILFCFLSFLLGLGIACLLL